MWRGQQGQERQESSSQVIRGLSAFRKNKTVWRGRQEQEGQGGRAHHFERVCALLTPLRQPPGKHHVLQHALCLLSRNLRRGMRELLDLSRGLGCIRLLKHVRSASSADMHTKGYNSPCITTYTSAAIVRERYAAARSCGSACCPAISPGHPPSSCPPPPLATRAARCSRYLTPAQSQPYSSSHAAPIQSLQFSGMLQRRS